jgi:hypothetical protein
MPSPVYGAKLKVAIDAGPAPRKTPSPIHVSLPIHPAQATPESPSPTIMFNCSHCGQSIEILAVRRGETVQCPTCAALIVACPSETKPTAAAPLKSPLRMYVPGPIHAARATKPKLPSAMAQVACPETDRRILPAFLLLLLFGPFGAHAFYARRKWRGIAYLAVTGCLMVATLWRASSDAYVEYTVRRFSGKIGGDYLGSSYWDSETLRIPLSDEHSQNAMAPFGDQQDAANQWQAGRVLSQETANHFQTDGPHEDKAGDLSWPGKSPQPDVVAELVEQDHHFIEHALNQKQISEVLPFIQPLFVIILGVLLIGDLIRIITGSFRDGNGAKLSRWT